MKKICAIFVGIVLFGIGIFGFDKYLDSQIKDNKEAVRNLRTYERYWSADIQKLVMDDNTLPVFGSSELVSLEDYHKNISGFLNSQDMNIVTMGAGYFQSLSHAVELGAISDKIVNNKVALFLSPQWFFPQGVSQEMFPERFGEDNLLNFLSNKKISDANKEYVLDRTLSLLADSPTQHDRVEKYKNGFENKLSANNLYTQIMNEFWDIRAKYSVYRQFDTMSKDIPVVDLKNMDYTEMLNLAQKQGEENCTNNDFGIYDEYWDTYVKEVYKQGEILEKESVGTESPEYGDLECFLNVAKELGIKVILVSIPVNEKWYSYQGQLFDEYYEKIRQVAKTHDNVKLVDMSVYAGEKYFHKDIMHLGWKGWVRVNEALYREFKE